MKRIIAFLLMAITLFTSFDLTVLANSQAPVSDMNITGVNYTVDKSMGSTILKPRMTLNWKEPVNPLDPPNFTGDNGPVFYTMQMRNLTLNKSNTRVIPVNHIINMDDRKTYDVHQYNAIDAGSLYEMSVVPAHYHYFENGRQELAPVEGTSVKKLALTDVNVSITTEADNIVLIWDDVMPSNYAGYPHITGVNYNITYATGDYSQRTKQDLMGAVGRRTIVANKTGGASVYKAESITVDGRAKLRLELSGDIYPGLVYSIMVEPQLVGAASNEVVQNVNFPHIYTVTTELGLTVYEEGEYVRLEWKVPNIFKVEGADGYQLTGGEIIEYIAGQQERPVVSFTGNGARIEYYMLPKPSQEVEYRLVLQAKKGESEIITASSPKVPYVPSHLRVTPTQPMIPAPISKTILDSLPLLQTDFVAAMRQKYLVTGDNRDIDRRNILQDGRTFQILNKNTIQLVFSAFSLKNEAGTTITDENVLYDIYVAKNLNDLAYDVAVLDSQRLTDTIKDNAGRTVGYRVNLETYYDADKNSLQPIVPNELYYIKVVAKKRWGTEEAKSVPSIAAILFDGDGNVYAPPVLSKPPLRLLADKTTTTNIGLGWSERWHEVYIPEGISSYIESSGVENTWITEAWLYNGKLYTEAVAGGKYYPIYTSGANATEFIRDFMALTGESLYQRTVDLGTDPLGTQGVQYEFERIPYSEAKRAMENFTGTESEKLNAYLLSLYMADQNGTTTIDWKKITPTRDAGDSNKLSYIATGLTENTQYILLLRPYSHNYNGDILYSHYISGILGVTDADGQSGIPDPTVPNLYTVGYTDVTATIAWKFSHAFEYELVMNTVEDVSTAKPVTLSFPTDVNDPLYPSNGVYYEEIVKGLFPNTQYYFWIRAKEPINNKISAWSNALILTTTDVELPQPPDGIGLAAMNRLRPHNINNNRGTDYLTLEWILNYGDKPESNEGLDIKKYYVYLLEIADNPNFIDPIYAELSDGSHDIVPAEIEKIEKNLLKINDLLPNRRYYVRMKTKVIVEGSGQEQSITKVSQNYSVTISLNTMPSSGEYDGDSSDVVVLPSEYYEIIYNEKTKELTHRFRYNKTGAGKDFDQFIAEQLISELIKDEAYNYQVNIQNYKDKPIVKRNVIIPYRLWVAFQDGKIGLEINTDKIKMQLPFNVIQSAVANQLRYGQSPDIIISIEEKGSYMSSALPSSQLTQVLTAQDINITLNASNSSNTIRFTDKPITYHMQVDSRYSAYSRQPSLYYYDAANRQWMLESASYENVTRSIVTTKSKLGIFSGYNLKDVNLVTHWSDTSKNSLLRQQGIINLDMSSPNKQVTTHDFMKILYGILMEENTINMSVRLTESQIQSLVYSKLLSSTNVNGTITREQAISSTYQALIKLNSSGRVTPSQATQNTVRNAGTNTNYVQTISSAYEIGLISSVNNLRPKDALTYAEMYVLLDGLLSAK